MGIYECRYCWIICITWLRLSIGKCCIGSMFTWFRYNFFQKMYKYSMYVKILSSSFKQQISLLENERTDRERYITNFRNRVGFNIRIILNTTFSFRKQSIYVGTYLLLYHNILQIILFIKQFWVFGNKFFRKHNFSWHLVYNSFFSYDFNIIK